MGETVLVVGGAGGVGLETCRLLVEKGYDVVATVLNESERAALLGNVPGVARVELVDLGRGDDAALQLKVICASISVLGGAVCCAGFAKSSFLELASLADFRTMLEVNTISNVALYQAALPGLRKTRGNLVLISSLGGKYVNPMFGYYAASKFALEAIVDAMRRESSRWGVGVVAIQPGWIRTGMSKGYLDNLAAQVAELNEEQAALYGPVFDDMRRVGEGMDSMGMHPSEVAKVVVEAVEAETPETRYIVGDDAREVIRRSREWTDLAIDEDFYAAIPSLATP